MWLTIHTDHGPLLLGVWYRPPHSDASSQSIFSLGEEHDRLVESAVGTIVVGDMNVHRVSWLTFSNGNSLQGRQLHDVCLGRGWKECVREPTRKEYLLDLVLTDCPHAIKTEVLPEISDHRLVLAQISMGVPVSRKITRNVWHWKSADWDGLKEALERICWKDFVKNDVAAAVESVTQCILDTSKRFIKYGPKTFHKSSHEYLNEKCLSAIKKKMEAAGGANEVEATQACSKVLLEEFKLWQARMRVVLAELPKGSKKWWRLNSTLQSREGKCSSIPPLKENKKWILDPKEKANLFAKVWKAKSTLPPPNRPEVDFSFAEVGAEKISATGTRT